MSEINFIGLTSFEIEDFEKIFRMVGKLVDLRNEAQFELNFKSFSIQLKDYIN